MHEGNINYPQTNMETASDILYFSRVYNYSNVPK